jgi:cytohesin
LRLIASDCELAQVRRLLGEGAPVDGRGYDGWSPLHRAAAYGHEEAVEALINAGASLPLKTPDGFSALHWACEYGHPGVVRLLLKARAPVADVSDETLWTPLHRAALDGHLAVVKLLLSEGAPVAVRDREGDTPLHDAARNGHLAVVKALVAAWPVATPLDEPNHVGLSALELARRGSRGPVYEFLQEKTSQKRSSGSMHL